MEKVVQFIPVTYVGLLMIRAYCSLRNKRRTYCQKQKKMYKQLVLELSELSELFAYLLM